MYTHDNTRPGVAGSSRDWARYVWPILVGCSPVSPGCAHCVSAYYVGGEVARARRFTGLAEAKGGGFRWTGKVDLDWSSASTPGRWPVGERIFVAPFSDLFHPSVPGEFIRRSFYTMARDPEHVYLVLTKRAARASSMLSTIPHGPHIYLGVSIENQDAAEERLPLFADHLDWMIWANLEPLLGPVDLTPALDYLDWVAVGPEFGVGARECRGEWVEAVYGQARAAGVPIWVKGLLDGMRVEEAPNL